MTQKIFERAIAALGTAFDLLLRTAKSFNRNRGAEAAAGIAYYALFSLFPLALFLVIGASYFFEQDLLQQNLLDYVGGALPVHPEIITNNFQAVLELRRTVGILALASLVWSASGVFNSLVLNINRAWKEVDLRSMLKARLVALAIIVVLAILLALSLAVTALIELFPRLQIPLLGSISLYETLRWVLLSNTVSILIRFTLFWGLYRWVPAFRASRKAVFWGALLAALAWELVTDVFTWYLHSGLDRYRVVYGSLGTIVALLFWIYLSNWIALFGAHLTATLDRHKR